MFRKDYWLKGYYIDNHEKYECLSCKNEFIIGSNILRTSNRKTPICPYCGSIHTDSIVYTDDDELEELSNELGCLGIGIVMD